MDLAELTAIEVFANGKTNPQIPSGMGILLIQDGHVSVGRLNSNLDDFPPVVIEHPENQEELNLIAQKLIEQTKPEILNSETSQVLTCPPRLVEKMIWKKI